jgi:circadian clock protein KaiC
MERPVQTPVAAETGISGLDDVLAGGLPRNRLFLVQGDPGVGKTTLGLQFLLAGVSLGETVLYVSLAESREEIGAVADSHGWQLESVHVLELFPAEKLAGEEDNTLFHPADLELGDTIRQILSAVDRLCPSRVVIDSLSELRLLSQTSLRYRRQSLALKHYFASRDCTVLMLDDRTSEAPDLQLQSIAHGVLEMEQMPPAYGAERRRLRVVKLRGVRFRGGYHDFILRTGGMVVFPRLIAAEHESDLQLQTLSTGIAGLDSLFGGGLDIGTSTVIIGPPGSGKSTVALQVAAAAAQRGERAAIFAFDEGQRTVLARATALNIPLGLHVASGRVLLKQVDPAELSPGEFIAMIQHEVEHANLRLVIIDSLNGYIQAMPEEQFVTLQLHELLSYLGQRGVVTIMVMAQHGLLGPGMRSPIDVSYLADSVVLLRLFEAKGRIRRAISMLKKRSGYHENMIREIQLSSGAGIEIGPPLDQFEGVLTGVPRYLGGHEPLLDEAGDDEG